jgi:PPOX class probable F420-dependent enzyme
MNDQEARRRLAEARVGRLATVTPGGTPHVVPVVFALVDDVIYTAVDSKPKTTVALQRLANIDATARASLLVDHYAEDWSTLWWVRVDGSAQVLRVNDGHQGTPMTAGRPEQVGVGLDALTHKYPQYVDQPLTGPVIAVHLTRWRWWEAVSAT